MSLIKTIKTNSMITCRTCGTLKSYSNFYLKDKKRGRYSTKCKECEAKDKGIVHFGKLTDHKTLLASGKRTCCDCKEVKDLPLFVKNKSVKSGYSHVCYDCSKKRVNEYRTDSNKRLGEYHLKRFAIDNYGIRREDITADILDIAKLHIQAKRSLRYYLDGVEFDTLQKFASYVNCKYGISEHCVKKRIDMGHSEAECIISEFDFRSEFSNKSRGKVKVTDINTGQVQIYTSPKRVEKELNIANEVLNRCLNTGEIRKPYNNSKNKQTLKFEFYAT